MKKAYGGNVWTGKNSSPSAVFDLQDRIVFIGSSLISVLVLSFIIAGRSIPSQFFLNGGSGSGLWESKTPLYWTIAMSAGLTFCVASLTFLVLCRLGTYREFAPSAKFAFWVILPLSSIVCFVFMMSFSGH